MHGLLIVVASLVTEHRFQVQRQVRSSCTRDQIYAPYIGRQILNYWTTKEVLHWLLILSSTVLCKLPPNHPNCVSSISHDPQVPGFLGLCQGINTAVCLPIHMLSFTLLHVLPTLIQCPQTPSSYKLSASS